MIDRAPNGIALTVTCMLVAFACSAGVGAEWVADWYAKD
jgi:hypothetical protein